MSADEVRAGYIEAMGKELGELFHAVSDELTWIHWLWKQYRILFGEKPSRIELLNEAAPHFFQIVHNALFEGTLLAIARLVGPAKSVGRPNLAIERFPPLIAEKDKRDQAVTLIEKARSSAAFAVDWRNRRLAHRDLDLIRDTGAKPLLPATREKVEESLSALRDVLNYIERAYCSTTTSYNLSAGLGGAEALLYVIREGLQHQRERRARWERGEVHNDDLKTPEAL